MKKLFYTYNNIPNIMNNIGNIIHNRIDSLKKYNLDVIVAIRRGWFNSSKNN